MTFKNYYLPALISACMLSSCVDDKYDLSDIDTTVRVEVDNLTIPLNLDEILLSNIIKIEEGDQLQIVNGEYVISEKGSFSSSSVEIDQFTLKSQPLDPQKMSLTFNTFAASLAPEDAGYFEIDPREKQFDFSSDAVPTEITAIKSVKGNLTFDFHFTLGGLTEIAKEVELTDIEIQLPVGLHVTNAAGGTYNSATGVLSMPATKVSGNEYSFAIVVDQLDFEKMGATLEDKNGKHMLDVHGDFYVKSGKLIIKKDMLIVDTVTRTLDLTIRYTINDFVLEAISGNIKYDITGVNISDVNLNDLPDVLNQEGTNITLANPQIYLNIASPNPLEEYSIYAQSGLTISSIHGNVKTPYSIDKSYNDGLFTIGQKDGKSFYSFCIAPQQPADKNTTWVHFSDLGKVVSGNGIPSALSISLDNPCLPDQPVNDFKLGVKVGEIKGDYEFLAPVALADGSKIVYSDTMDGWDSEDLEVLTITDLHIAASITSELPMSLDFMAYPIDKDGNQIGNVEIKGAKIEASSTPQDVDIYITGTIRDLAGIKFTATATAENSNVLRPDMTIKVAKLRPRVSGYYEKEL